MRYMKKVQKPISLTTDISDSFQSRSMVMETIITFDMNSFFFSNNLISDQQFGYSQGHYALGMLLRLTEQWMEALNITQEIRAVSLDISRPFDTVWHPALRSPNSLSMKSMGNSAHAY